MSSLSLSPINTEMFFLSRKKAIYIKLYMLRICKFDINQFSVIQYHSQYNFIFHRIKKNLINDAMEITMPLAVNLGQINFVL